MDMDFECALEEHLRKEELLFRAKNKPHGSNCEWLAGFCSSTDSIAKLLRSLGFRIKEVTECDGAEWVETTSGVIVYGGTEGLVARAARCKHG